MKREVDPPPGDAASPEATPADQHAFVGRPHRTLLALTFPVMVSLVAEPLTGVVDTAFIARLGAAPTAALGVATMLLSSIFWIFNFLGVGTQTEVAQGLGRADAGHARDTSGLAMALALVFGSALGLLAWPLLGAAARFMSDDLEVQLLSITYLKIRLLGGPAVLLTVACFGALRGLQDMRTPLWIAIGANVANLVLDALLIFGAGPIPALGVAGAAWAATISHWGGALFALAAVRSRIGLPRSFHWHEAGRLLVVGRDLIARTTMLFLFVLVSTRAATLAGVESGAAHQAIRQVWMLTAFLLDAFAMTAQSLIAYFVAAQRATLARSVAGVSCAWGLGVGILLSCVMVLSEDAVALLLVPESARYAFPSAWLAAAAAQPLNALSFVTDGIHWGTRDYTYLRNAMITATAIGGGLVFAIDLRSDVALLYIWLATGVWSGVRALFGVVRIWPGFGRGPLAAHPR